MQDCIFCKIIKKEVPAEIVHETPNFIVFKDTQPKAPIHLLIVPKKHFIDMRSAPSEIWLEIQGIALELEKKNNLDGFVLGMNTGERAVVKHMHVHFLDKAPRENL